MDCYTIYLISKRARTTGVNTLVSWWIGYWGASISLASKSYMFYTFLFLSLAPLLFTFYFEENNVTNPVIIAIIFYILFLSLISKKVSKFITDNITLNYENKELITKLEEKVSEANKATEAKSKFLSVMSHEIRTPLNAIIGFVKILKHNETDKTKQNYLETIDSSSFLLMSVINDILDISKIESGSFSIESIEYEPHMELSHIYYLYETTAKEKGINLINSISMELPRYFKGDILRLKQILSNLLSNALKFTSKGKSIEFITSFNKENSTLHVEIKDQGIGIKEANIQKILKEFSQADDSTARKYGGTGLGLSIVTKLLELQNSKLEIKSEFGVGSSFSFELPVVLANIMNHDDQEIHYNFNAKKVLVAEDNKTNQMLIKILLDDLDIESKIAEDGLVAEKMFLEEKFDLILMDINMPNKNGLEAMKSIKLIDHNMPVVAVTANAISGDKEKYIQEGFNDYLTKPIYTKELNKILNKYLN